MKKYFYLLLVCTLFTVACNRGKLQTVNPVKQAYVDSSFAQNFNQTNGITAGIGASSLALNNGSIIWFFGKSHLNDYNVATQKIACNANANNGAMLQTGTTFTTLNNATNDFIPSNETNTWFTPLHAYQFFDTVFVFAKKEGTQQNQNTYIAKFHFPDFQFIAIDSMNKSNIVFGHNIIVDTALGFCFIYGSKNENPTGENNMYVARFSMTSPYATWSYYDGNEWSNFSYNVTPIHHVPAENFCVRKISSWYVLLTQDASFACNTGGHIYGEVASYPFGPFLNKNKLFTIQDKLNGVLASSKNVQIHPTFTSNKELLVTYSINGFSPCISTCNNNEDDPNYYRIKTIRVPLQSINPGF